MFYVSCRWQSVFSFPRLAKMRVRSQEIALQNYQSSQSSCLQAARSSTNVHSHRRRQVSGDSEEVLFPYVIRNPLILNHHHHQRPHSILHIFHTRTGNGITHDTIAAPTTYNCMRTPEGARRGLRKCVPNFVLLSLFMRRQTLRAHGNLVNE